MPVNLEFIEFLESGPYFSGSIDDVTRIHCSYNTELFRKTYEDNYNMKGVKIYRFNKSNKLLGGMVIDDGNSKLWYTMRPSAFLSYPLNVENMK